METGLNGIDWTAPWLAHLCPLGPLLAQRVCAGSSVADALNHGLGLRTALPGRWHFVPQQALASGVGYEAHIAQTGAIPTRDNLHDFFNGLMWLHFPRTKARMAALHAEQIALQPGAGSARGPVRDALTLLDENGALLLAPAAVVVALQAKDWAHLFGPLRSHWQRSRVLIVGHALLEQLVAPRKPLTAHVLAWSESPCASLPAALTQADALCAHTLHAPWLGGKPFAHLPVLGVPGWWPANGGLEQGDAAFYADTHVFRPLRRQSPSPHGASIAAV